MPDPTPTAMPVGASVVDVSGWKSDEDNPIYPVGSQPKRLLICPNSSDDDRLVPGHRYLFKVPIEWKANQVWSEFIAARLGADIGVEVPRCLLGHDGQGNFGALIEFFYGYPGQSSRPRLVHASDFLRTTISNPKTGKPHSARLNVAACQTLLAIPDAAIWWGKTLLFDALIGTTDRHPDNWGILAFLQPDRKFRYALAPAFDNGTSLGYEIPDGRLLVPWDASRITRYIEKGAHHCGWFRLDPVPLNHVGLCRIFASTYPEVGKVMQEMLAFAPSRLESVWQDCIDALGSRPFTRSRAAFVSALIEARRLALTQALET